jgi:hypothetical protein
MVYFSSTAIRAANYHAGTRTLTLWFTSGRQRYDYPHVPQAIYDGLLSAPSKGSYFNRYIRDQYAV